MIAFTKAHACGNDFLIVREEDASGFDLAELTRYLCDRNTGIGADGVEYFSETGEHSGRIHLYNADGSVAEISGNGTRCVAAWMADRLNSQAGDVLALETDAGARTCTIDSLRVPDFGGPTVMVTTDMDVPEFEQQTIELADGTVIDGVFVSMGNPHFVILLSSADREDRALSSSRDISEEGLASLDFSINGRPWEEVGEEICFHPDFPDQTNVEFVRILGNESEPADMVAFRIFERGVGPTASSGTGTSATATAMIGTYGAVSPLDVIAPGGAQTVQWAGQGEKLYLTGPAILIAHGEAL